MNSVLSALRIFEEVAMRQPIGVSELARVAEMPKSTVQRSLTTLQTAGWLRVVDPDRVRWGLTMKALTLGIRNAGEQDFREVSAPVIRRLAAETDETVHLGLRDGEEWVIVAREDSTQIVRVFLEIGRRLPLRATSGGVAIMSLLDEAESDRINASTTQGLAEFPTLTTEELRHEIATTRERGYAVNISSSWYRPHVASVGAAVTNPVGQPMGAVVISVPEGRFDDDRQHELGDLVVAAAAEISSMVAST